MSHSQEQHKMDRTLDSLHIPARRKNMRRSRFAGLALITVVPFLAGCDAAPQPPAHTNAWLSYKFSRNCPSPSQSNNLSGCPALIDVSEASNYYNTIGANALVAPPNGTLFDAWLAANGFTSGAQDVRAVYGNRGDLAFGRDMHCLQSGQNIACYVTNYGPPPISFLGAPRNPDWVGINNSGDTTYTF